MQQPQEKRRCSILKKRRSRSLSPKSPQRENTARRASRRISFSGKHNVREFFTNENTAIVWGETYDVSTEKHVLSNEQITLQSTRSSSMSANLQITRNDSTVMDISSALPTVATNEEKKPFGVRSSTIRKPYDDDQKENVMVINETDMELSLIMQPPSKPAPSKPLFSESSSNLSARASAFRPSLFNFTRKSDVNGTMSVVEKTSGSDNMDISGIEPTLPTDELEIKPPTSGSKYLDFLKQNNLIVKPKSALNSHRLTVNKSIDIQLDKSQVMGSHPTVEPEKLPQKSNSRKTINELHDMSIDNNEQGQHDTTTGVQDIVESPIPQSILSPKSILQSNKCTTIHEPFEMSIGNNDLTCAQLSDMSIEFLPSELESHQNRRKTTLKIQDISLDTPTFGMNPRQMTENLALDMSLETVHWKNSPLIQQRNSKKSTQPSNRMTINEPREISFDSTTKSASQTYNNRTIFGDISMDMQHTGTYQQSSRKSVICKSPSKNVTKLFDQSNAFEYTKGADLYTMDFSYHPLHSTRLNDGSNNKFTDIDRDKSVPNVKVESDALNLGSDIDETFIGEARNEVSVQELPKQVKIFNRTKQQSINETCDLDMSEDSPVSTAKKYNLNKTPFYFGIDKENDPALIETMRASDLSSLDLTNNSKEEKQFFEHKPEPGTEHRGTVLFHATIQNDSDLHEANETNTIPIEISDSSIIAEPQNPAATDWVNTKRKTCFQEISMAMESIPTTGPKQVGNIMTQSIIQITPIKIDESIDEKPPTRVGDNNRLTIVKNETIALDNSPFDYKNISNGLEESKQLTFIEDEDEDDQICNTKLDLAISLENSDIDDPIERKYGSLTNKSYNISRFSLHSEIDMPSMHSEQSYPMKDITLPMEPLPPLSDALKVNELNAFKKSCRLRHSNVFDANTTAEDDQNESIVNEEASARNISVEPMKNNAMEPVNNISMAPISRSSIIQRRNSSIGSNNDANETSYLSKSTADKPLSEIKLDFSGYDKLVGLATPQDVFKDFCNRMDQIKRKAKQWEDERNKFANGEIDSIDPFNNNNDDDLISENVEAPSWSYLYMNKMKWEDEQQEAEIDRLWEQRVVGAYLPVIPDISILTLNKCRMLKNWRFDDIWFFQGNIHLRNNLMPVFKVCLIYDPNTTEQSIDVYGALKFTKINRQFCPKHLSQRNYSVFLLEVQELKSKLPSNLLSLCETSAYLSDFDHKMNEYCVKAQNKVNELHRICRKVNALIKEENGSIYILKTMLDFKAQKYQDYIIELSDIDSTEWRNVRTNPRRVLNEEIKSLPKGVAFIKELLANDEKYVPWA